MFGQKIFQSIMQNSIDTFARFPLGILLLGAITSLFFYQIANSYPQNIVIVNITLSAIITFFLSIGITLWTESQDKKSLLSYIFQIIAFLFGGAFYWSLGYGELGSFENILQLILTLICFISFVFIAPFLNILFKKDYKNAQYHNYFMNLSKIILMSMLVGGILSIGGVIAIGSVDILFDLKNFPNDLYGYWVVLSLSFLSPVYFLSQIPTSSKIDTIGENYNFFNFIIRFIAIPFIYLYFIILYIYSIKVLANFGDWPKGQVSWLVIGFSLFGYITYVLSYHLDEKNVFVKYFRKFFPYIVLPQVGMLFYAIYLRIAQYDLTINRYLVVAFGIWLIILSVFFILSKEKRISYIPLGLIIMISVISIGPWGVFSYPESRQYQALLQDLREVNILQDQKITPLQTGKEISPEMSEQIYDRIRYLCEFNHCNSLKTLFDTQIQEYFIEHKIDYNSGIGIACSEIGGCEYNPQTTSKWEIVEAISQTLKISYNFRQTDNQRPYLQYYPSTPVFPIQIEGYNIIGNIYGENFTSSKLETQEKIFIKVDISAQKATIYEDGLSVQEIDISSFVESFAHVGENIFEEKISQDFLTYDFIEGTYQGKLLFENITIPNPNAPESTVLDYKYLIGASGKFLLKK